MLGSRSLLVISYFKQEEFLKIYLVLRVLVEICWIFSLGWGMQDVIT